MGALKDVFRSVFLRVCLFSHFLGRITGALNEPVKVVVKEDSDAVLPCSLSTEENIEFKQFDWKKDGQKNVFIYDGGLHYNNGHPGQDRQFKGRVFHFQDELKHGNASIIIRNTKVADSGNYTCNFPHLRPTQTFHKQLVVIGAASKPYVTILDQTKDGMKLQCEVRGVSPKPEVEWKDSSENIIPAEEPKMRRKERGGSYDIILEATVTKTDRYRCVVTQKEIYYQMDAEIFVPVIGPLAGWIVAAVLGTLAAVSILLGVLYCKGFIKVNYKTGPTKSPPLEGETHPVNSLNSHRPEDRNEDGVVFRRDFLEIPLMLNIFRRNLEFT